MKLLVGLAFGFLVLGVAASGRNGAAERPRAREFGLAPGSLETGSLNAITDVAGVLVGHVTLVEGDDVRTGVTAILPHGGNVFQDKVPGAIAVANGFGKLAGFTQVEELGNIETPIVLTNTLSVPTAADAVIDYILGLPGNESVQSINPVVGETNDGGLNDIRGRHVRREHVLRAIREAAPGAVAEGSVGAGTGTVCFGFKGGIGTSSRRLPEARGGYTVGVLVQTNFGGRLRILGFPVGDRLAPRRPGREPGPAPGMDVVARIGLGEAADPGAPTRGIVDTAAGGLFDDPDRDAGAGGASEAPDAAESIDGSCMIVVATDAPLDARNLKRLARRALLGIPRTGGYYSNGSGDYAIAFSTATGLRVPHRPDSPTLTQTVLGNDAMSPLFLAAAEAAEEAILNSLFRAERIEGRGGRAIEPLPLDRVREILAPILERDRP